GYARASRKGAASGRPTSSTSSARTATRQLLTTCPHRPGRSIRGSRLLRRLLGRLGLVAAVVLRLGLRLVGALVARGRRGALVAGGGLGALVARLARRRLRGLLAGLARAGPAGAGWRQGRPRRHGLHDDRRLGVAVVEADDQAVVGRQVDAVGQVVLHREG